MSFWARFGAVLAYFILPAPPLSAAAIVLDVLTALSDCRHETVEKIMERRISGVSYMCWIDFHNGIWGCGLLCTLLISLYFLLLFLLLFHGYHAKGYHAPSIYRGLSRPGLPRPIYTARATTPLPPLHSYHACVYPGYHAKGYHAPYLPPRAITPVYTSRLPHQSYHAPPYLVHRVITPAIVVRIL